eukprot:TRINITY_DN5564_c0_g1_i1.p1 TRINITY_DN5564_c0_g1~~TRINITY_DN5564_c0_g1_i1.p1  ORF type:complete len:586 (+),score=102.44 TRINITY_DN5564_c0_g1_i1:60-1817(+)
MSRVTTRSMSSSDVPLPVFGVPLVDVMKRRSNPGGIPQFLHDMFAYLESQQNIDAVFRSSVTPSQIQKLKAIYDSDLSMSLASVDPVIVLGVVKAFLKDIPGCLIPFDYYSKFVKIIESSNEPERFKNVRDLLDAIPVENQKVLKLLVGFLFRLQVRTDANSRVDKNTRLFVTALAPLVLRPRTARSQPTDDQTYASRVLVYFTDCYEYLFSTKKTSTVLVDFLKFWKKTTQPDENQSKSDFKSVQSTNSVIEGPIGSETQTGLALRNGAELDHTRCLSLINTVVSAYMTEENYFSIDKFGFVVRRNNPQADPMQSANERLFKAISSLGVSVKEHFPQTSQRAIEKDSERPLAQSQSLAQGVQRVPSIFTNLGQQSSVQSVGTNQSWIESPLSVAERRLAEDRKKDCRPEDIRKMNAAQLCDEKAAIKKELRVFDLAFFEKNGREPLKSEKEVLRPLYQKYKELKSLIGDSPSGGINTNSSLKKSLSLTSSVPSTSSTLSKLLEEKKVLQVKLHEYQTNFYQKHGANAKLIVDHSIKNEYNRYKELKHLITEAEEEQNRKSTLFGALANRGNRSELHDGNLGATL